MGYDKFLCTSTMAGGMGLKTTNAVSPGKEKLGFIHIPKS
jgi:hypothetical protein